MINLPSRIVKGQAITAEWANSIRESLARLAGPNGREVTPQLRRPMMPFKGYGLRMDGETLKVRIAPGYFLSMHPTEGGEELGTGEFVRYVMPLIGIVPLDDEDAPDLVVEAGQTVYLEVETDIRDRPTGLPQIVADVADKQGVINYPPASGIARVYYYAIFDISDDEAPRITRQRQIGGPLVHTPAPAGWWGSLVFEFYDDANDEELRTSFIVKDGRILSASQSINGGTTITDIPGTAGDPGSVTHLTTNTDT
jgi:hypothetical protein